MDNDRIRAADRWEALSKRTKAEECAPAPATHEHYQDYRLIRYVTDLIVLTVNKVFRVMSLLMLFAL